MINPTILLSALVNLISIVMMLTTKSWIIMWMSFELNMISFIPMMLNKSSNFATESILKYFMIQTLGSIMFIAAMIMGKIPMITGMSNSQMITLAMLTKLGAFPVFQWLPSVSEGLQWMSLTLLLTTQKIMPFMVLLAVSNSVILITAASISALVGSIGGYNQTMTRKLLAYSSITHMGWMIMLTNNVLLILLYIFIYSFIMLSMTMQLKEMMLLSTLISWQKKMTKNFLMTLLSLGGLPPLLGFIPKLMSINWIIKTNLVTLPFLITGALVNLSYYFNIIMKSMLYKTSINNFQGKFSSSTNFMITLSLTMTFLMMMY